MDYSEFRVNFKDFDRPRPIGVSGILRMMNDEEFLESSIESCVNCLDELIVVYNETSPESLAIINRMKRKYPDKIRVYKYLPELYNGNLSQEEFDAAMLRHSDYVTSHTATLSHSTKRFCHRG